MPAGIFAPGRAEGMAWLERVPLVIVGSDAGLLARGAAEIFAP